MNGIRLYGYLIILMASLGSCATTSKRKSAQYYKEHEQTVLEMRMLFDRLYQHQPFSLGFSDKSYKYYVMEVKTDTMRYIYNTDKSRKYLYETIARFQYDTAALMALARKMKEIKCLWMAKASFYIDEKKETLTFLSFKSPLIEGPFVENKYYTLLFLEHPMSNQQVAKRVQKGELIKINDLVYFTIGTRFR